MPQDAIGTPSAYEVRLEKLEKQNVWMRTVIAILVVLFIVNFIVTRPRSFGTVTASEFDLRDSTGAVRGKLGMLPDGPGLQLFAASGEERATLVGAAEDANLNLYVPVTASASSTAGVNLFEGTKQIASLSGGPSATTLQIDSAAGMIAASLTANSDFALLGLQATEYNDSAPIATSRTNCLKRADAQGEKPLSLGAMVCLDSQQNPLIILSDRKGKSLWSAPR